MPSGTAVIPRRVRNTLTEIGRSPEMREGIDAMLAREKEFDSKLAAKLVGVAVVPEARRHFDEALDEMWAANTTKRVYGGKVHDEVVIGAGLHAAIYCAVRVKEGFKAPLVIEASQRAGGAFAVSREATFYLNSRNRPGKLSTPGRPGALNSLPGAIIQPSDLSGEEYQRNSDLAFVVRATLASSATVCTGLRAEKIFIRDGYSCVKLTDDQTLDARRVIVATGLGEMEPLCQSERYMTFPDFMAHMGSERFPLRNMGTVAVVGAGDSGKTAVEALVGQGPPCGWSVASLDRPSRIDWYGCDEAVAGVSEDVRARWESCNRSRYRGIGRALATPEGSGTVYPLAESASDPVEGYECIDVNGRLYDYVIDCRGFTRSSLLPAGLPTSTLAFGGLTVASRGAGSEVYMVGPAADIQITEAERASNKALGEVPENSTSLFRYAGRTAKLAEKLPQVKPRPRPGVRTTNLDIRFDATTANVNVDVSKLDAFVCTARDGTKVYEGDIVKVAADGNFEVLGRAATRSGAQSPSGVVVVDRQGGTYKTKDGRIGFGYYDSSIVGVVQPRKIVDPKPIATDKDGKDIFVGSRVRREGVRPFDATVIGLDVSNSACIVLDRGAGTGKTAAGLVGWKTRPGYVTVL